MGTALLVFLGTGAIVEGSKLGGVPQADLALAWFAAVAIPVLAFARTSGAHINPAVTVALVIARRFRWQELSPYMGAQFTGAFLGSGLVGSLIGTNAHWGATLPWHGDIALVVPLEFGFTAALVLSVLYLTTPGRPPSNLELTLPATVVGISTFLIGPWTGSSLNPARTLAPAVLSGDYLGMWVYLATVTVSAIVTAGLMSRR